MELTVKFTTPDQIIALLTGLRTFFREDDIESLALKLKLPTDALAAALRDVSKPQS